MGKTIILVVKVDGMLNWLSINTVLPLLPLRIYIIFSLETTRVERSLASLYSMTSYQPPNPPPRIINMDASVFISRPFTITDLADMVKEILRTITTLNTRAIKAEKIIAKYEYDLAIARHTLANTSKELDDTVKVAELLYSVNSQLRAVTDHLLREQGIALGDREPKSVEVLINSLLQQTEAEERLKPTNRSVIIARSSSSRSTDIKNTIIS